MSQKLSATQKRACNETEGFLHDTHQYFSACKKFCQLLYLLKM